MPARVLQINISKGGLPKLPIPVASVGTLGIAGDRHRYKDHGGPRKALLLMAAETIDTLRAEGWPVTIVRSARTSQQSVSITGLGAPGSATGPVQCSWS